MKEKNTWLLRLTGDSGGYVLIAAMMILLVLTLIGIAANRNTTTELQIAANDKIHKQTFYEADGGTEYAAELLEQNIACIGFDHNGTTVQYVSGTSGPLAVDTYIAVESGSKKFWQNAIGTWSGGGADYPSDTDRDIWLPPNYAAGEPHTNITIEGRADLNAGSSIIQAAGYLGLGRSMSSGGVKLDYDIFSQHIGADNSISLIRVEWRHIVGREDPFCNYD